MNTLRSLPGFLCVAATSGTVQGVTSAGVTKFLGVPYAEPPLGALRWARPVAKSPLPGTMVTALRAALTGAAALSPAGAAKCRIETGSAACDVVDIAVLKRRLQSLPPGIAQACAAANPA